MRQQYTIQILAPKHTAFGEAFAQLRVDGDAHRSFLRDIQQLRGRVYRADDAIRPCDLNAEGGFRMKGDDESWHLLLVDGDGRVVGCVRYLVHANTIGFQDLRISRCSLASDPVWADGLQRAVEYDLKLAREQGLCYVEVGGWALEKGWRGGRAALEIALGSFALGRLWGGAIGSCTATWRHGSASILRRLGGEALESGGEVIPRYHDEVFGCPMEVLRFDYRRPAERYMPLVRDLAVRLVRSRVIAAGPVKTRGAGEGDSLWRSWRSSPVPAC